MSTLSKTQLLNIIKKYVEDLINDFELQEATGNYLNPNVHDNLLDGYDWVLSESHDALAERNHVREMSDEGNRVSKRI